MKFTKKITLAGISAACALTLSLSVGLLAENRTAVHADDEAATIATQYFYDNLVDSKGGEYKLAKKFYDAFEKLNDDGDFIDGVVDYPINDVVTSDQLKGWIEDGDLEVPKAFSAARDAFRVDHPELFYIDVYKLTISVAKSGGTYVGFINSGRESDLYYENGLNTKSEVEGAIAAYNKRVDEIVAIVNDLETKNTYSARDVYLAREVNKYLANNITYDYVAYDNKDDPNYIAAAYINTAYGGLVEGKAVCGGFSTSYKVIMDKLGIPCITVNGYTNNKDENGNNAASNVYHMWNYVWLETPEAGTAKALAARDGGNDGRWYSVDVTWNNSAANKYRYAVMNANDDGEIHVTDGVISSSGYELKYPELSPYNYGSTGETDGLKYSCTYTPTGEKDDYNNDLVSTEITVSYNGKSARKLLEEDGLYLAYRLAAYENNEIEWTDWMSLEITRQFYEKAGLVDYMKDSGIQTTLPCNANIFLTQFAVFDIKPTRATSNKNPDATLGFDPETQSHYFFYYSNDDLNKTSAISISEALVNESYGTYTPAPYILSDGHAQMQTISDSMRGADGFIAESKAFTYEIAYDEPLHKLDPSKPIGITFTSEHPNAKDYAKFYPLGKDENGKPIYVELIEGYENSGSTKKILNTLRFKFAPSLMYEHNLEGYHIAFSNVGSAKQVMKKNATTGELEPQASDKVPNPVYYYYGRLTGVCPARFNYDGRLYVECCAQPTLLTQTDLSEDNFKDENGNSTFSANERSQMLLIAEKANDETVNSMLDGITENDNINVTKDDIKTSETYDISLQICKKYPTIPDGSYVKMALGFPEGYGPNDAGVTFKLFHRKHVGGDNYIIEEIPCVVTQFGIVATVTSFSPYMVAVVDADKTTDKTIYASIEGKGGNLTLDDGKIQSLTEGGSYTYTVKPNDGYQVYAVKLNGNDVKDRLTADGKLTVNYDELDGNNELVIQYIANSAATRIKTKIDSNVIDENVIVDATQFVVPLESGVTQPKNNTALIVAVVICSVILVAVVVTVVIIMKKRKA